MTKAALSTIKPGSRALWRRWLTEHHNTSSGVWVILRKKRAGPRSLSLEDAVEEALCFGWIDSTLHPLDEQHSALLFTPRRPGSTWSPSNKRRVTRLIAQGSMTDAGLKVVHAAQRDGSWQALDAIEALQVPEDLALALSDSPQAGANFSAFPPSAQKQFLWWIASAKRSQTRARRIAATVRLAASNLRLSERTRNVPRRARPARE